MKNDQATSTLLWALDILGVKYLPQEKCFQRVADNTTFYGVSPVDMARDHVKTLRRYEVLTNQQYPAIIQEHIQLVRSMLPQLRASTMARWKTELEETLEKLEADLHNSQSPRSTDT